MGWFVNIHHPSYSLTLLFWYAVTAINMVSGKQNDCDAPEETHVSFR